MLRVSDGTLRREFAWSPGDLDEGGRPSARALCACMQDAAGEDARRRGVGLDRLGQDGLAWMLVRLTVEIERAAPGTGAGSPPTLAVVTWPRLFGGAVAERDFVVEEFGGRTLAQATSRWAVVDLEARRAVRAPAFLRALPVHPRAVPVQPLPAWEMPPAAAGGHERRLEVTAVDLDRLGHANNVRYVEWALGALPPAFLRGRALAFLDVAFRREARLGDRLVSRAVPVDEANVAHELRAADGEVVYARAWTRWRRD